MTKKTGFRSAFVNHGTGGWGRGLQIDPSAERPYIVSVTGGGIHPVAARLAELTGAQAIDGFTKSVPDSEVAAVVINCGGTARIGVYPKKGLLTIDVFPGEPSGPLADFINEENFVSAVTPNDIVLLDGTGSIPSLSSEEIKQFVKAESAAEQIVQAADEEANAKPRGMIGAFSNVATGFGSVMGNIINTLLAAARKAIQLVMQTILPFMAYVSLLIGIVTYTGLSDLIAHGVTPLASNPLGLILLGIITGLPFLSPILGPGAAIAQVIGVLMGTQIASGALPVPYALPALFAIDGQVGCDFVPVGLALGEAKPETVAIGVPAVLFSRLVTSPVAVVIAWGASFALV